MSGSTIFQIEIPKRNTLCAHGQEPFSQGMEMHSILTEGPEEGIYVRKDYCLSCWEKISTQMISEGVRSFWKSKIPKKKENSDLPKQRDARAMHLLKEALLRHSTDDYAEAFILAMYLARKRHIFFRQDIVLEEVQKASIYEVAQTEEMLCVRKVDLTSLEIEKIQTALAIKFKS